MRRVRYRWSSFHQGTDAADVMKLLVLLDATETTRGLKLDASPPGLEVRPRLAGATSLSYQLRDRIPLLFPSSTPHTRKKISDLNQNYPLL